MKRRMDEIATAADPDYPLGIHPYGWVHGARDLGQELRPELVEITVLTPEKRDADEIALMRDVVRGLDNPWKSRDAISIAVAIFAFLTVVLFFVTIGNPSLVTIVIAEVLAVGWYLISRVAYSVRNRRMRARANILHVGDRITAIIRANPDRDQFPEEWELRAAIDRLDRDGWNLEAHQQVYAAARAIRTGQ